jgi:hypothetical protein
MNGTPNQPGRRERRCHPLRWKVVLSAAVAGLFLAQLAILAGYFVYREWERGCGFRFLKNECDALEGSNLPASKSQAGVCYYFTSDNRLLRTFIEGVRVPTVVEPTVCTSVGALVVEGGACLVCADSGKLAPGRRVDWARFFAEDELPQSISTHLASKCAIHE